jgi:plasmid stabilization system protein ParE
MRRYHPLVADDLTTAVSYYDDISVDLGNRFRTSVRDLIATITDRPDSYGRIHKQLRVAMVNRFPYVILFEHEVESITILGVFHAASDRKGWFERSL